MSNPTSDNVPEDVMKQIIEFSCTIGVYYKSLIDAGIPGELAAKITILMLSGARNIIQQEQKNDLG